MSRFTPRKGMPSPRLDEAEFRKRFLAQFRDPGFNSLAQELDKIAAAAWDAYSQSRKAPRTRKAGSQFADPDYDLSVDWLAARDAIVDAHGRHADRSKRTILLINCSARSEHTCPGEMSKSYRLVEIAREVFAAAPGSASSCSISAASPRSMGVISIPAKRASRQRPRCVIGRVRATPIIRSARHKTG